MNKKVKTIVIVLCCCLAIGVSYATLARSNDNTVNPAENNQADFNIPQDAIVHEDTKMDAMQKKQGMYFELPKDEKAQITSEAAIEAAKKHAPGLAEKATGITAEFLLYSHIPQGVEQRPVWVVTFKGASVEPRQPIALPPVVETIILIDGNTGDVISLTSIGHNSIGV